MAVTMKIAPGTKLLIDRWRRRAS